MQKVFRHSIMHASCRYWAILLVMIAVITAQGVSQKGNRCAIPMSIAGNIAFQALASSSNESYNITQYKFDELVCTLEGLVDNRETYRCRTGNILRNESLTATQQAINADQRLGNVICRTKEQPNIKPQSNVTFICEDTSLVQPERSCFMRNTECFILPISLYRSNDQSFKRAEDELNKLTLPYLSFHDGHEFRCPRYFFSCYWQRCSSLLVVGTPITKYTKPYYLLSYLSELFENILETPNVPTSLEITNTHLTYLPDVLCRYKDLQRLAIVYNKIKVLPKCLHKMVKLKILDVSFNALESIEEIDFGSEQLKLHLDLSYNQINSVKQDAFSRLENLVFLTLRNNSLGDINFSLPTDLEILDLSHNSIKYIQSAPMVYLQTGIRIPNSLQVFDLSFNQIEFIDSRLFETAASLETLHLNNNRIKVFQLPWDKISGTGFPNLAYINLTKNHIENLDESLFTKKIKTLDVSYNQIKSIDLGLMKEANNLTELRLDHNNITEIKDGILNGSETITTLPNMTYLDLSHNQIRVAPLSLIFMENMKMINFSRNKIEKCTWSNMPYKYILKNIDEKITGSFLSSCFYKGNFNGDDHMIDLNYNQIKSLQDVFLSPNIMQHKDATLFWHIRLTHNPLHCDCKMYPYLEQLLGIFTQILQNKIYDQVNIIVSKSTITKLSKGNVNFGGALIKKFITCETPKTFRSRTIDTELINDLRCNLLPNEKCTYTFHPSDQLLTVNCSNQNLTKIPVINESLALALNKSMAENQMPHGLKANIILSGNNFTTLNSSDSSVGEISLPCFIQVKMHAHVNLLDLSHSNIRWDAFFFLFALSLCLPDLTHLYLNNNKLTHLPVTCVISFLKNETESKTLLQGAEVIPFWDRVLELHLYSNPWFCTCDALYMKTWLNNLIARRIIVRPNEIKCAFPDWNQGKMVHIVEDSDFCPVADPKLVTYIIVICAEILFIAFIKMILLFRDESKPQLLNRDNIKDDKNIKYMEFDAFVSYCEADAGWVEHELIPHLEQQDPPYRVCQHKQDFLPWMTKDWNEFNAIKHSRRIIIVMSNLYRENEHCMRAYRAAISYWICIKNSPRLVVIKYPEVETRNELYFKRFAYLEKDEHTIERLLQFMPRENLARLADWDEMIIRGENLTSMFAPDNQKNMIDDNNMEDMEIDVFVSYCQPDAEWVEKELIPGLEQYNQSFRVCHHKQCFFLPGNWNEFKAIKRSRRTIIIMSNSYLERQHCMKEFEAAFSYWIRTQKSPRLLVIKYPDVATKNIPYLRHFAYIYKDEHTVERLLPFMPRESLAQLANRDSNIMGGENLTGMFASDNKDDMIDDDNMEDMEFDVFVSYCEADAEWVEYELIPLLEQHDPPYRVCQHKRHFRPWMTTDWNEFYAIKHSRRTIIIMSNSYRQRKHCMKEFDAAYKYWIRLKRSPRLVVIKYPDVEIENEIYFRDYTYLEKNEYTFERLFPFMPKENLAQLADRNYAMNGGENPNGLFASAAEQAAQTLDSDEERRMELQREDEIFAKKWQDAELEAAERIKAGEDISAEDIIEERLGLCRHRSTKHGLAAE